mgnify:CR=1 FL=1
MTRQKACAVAFWAWQSRPGTTGDPIFDENSTGREKRPSKISKIGGSPDADPLQMAAEGVKELQKVGCGPIKRRIRTFFHKKH